MSATPRVNATVLQLYVGHTVRLVGKVSDAKAGKVTLLSSDNQNITVTTKDTNSYTKGSIHEVIGKVEQDGEGFALEEYNQTKFSDNFAMDVLEDYLQVTHAFPKIFATIAPPQ